ncbi:3846_t:CDS:1, partial [Gigaspora rosea]
KKMPFANICISKRTKNIHRWYIYPIPYEMTIKDFFVKLTTGELSSECNIGTISSEAIEHIELSNKPITGATQVNLNCNIMEVTTAIGI